MINQFTSPFGKPVAAIVQQQNERVMPSAWATLSRFEAKRKKFKVKAGVGTVIDKDYKENMKRYDSFMDDILN